MSPEIIAELNAWRHILFCLKLIGGRLDRYQGLGFGNISARESTSYSTNFIITGSQTGHFPNLKLNQYVRIEKADLQNFRLVANGDCSPSSESFTHAAPCLERDEYDAMNGGISKTGRVSSKRRATRLSKLPSLRRRWSSIHTVQPLPMQCILTAMSKH